MLQNHAGIAGREDFCAALAREVANGVSLIKPRWVSAGSIALGSAATALAGGISDDVVKIGVLDRHVGTVFARVRVKARSRPSRWRWRISAARCLASRSRSSSADHQNKPDIASAIARKWYDVEKVDMIANLINSSVALGVSQTRQGQGTHRHHQRLGLVPSDQRRMHAEQRSLCLRHLFAGARVPAPR